MTEVEWRTCGSRVHMRRSLRQRPLVRRRWLRFNLACVERVRDLLDDSRSQELLRVFDACERERDVWAFGGWLTPQERAAREAIRDLWRRRGDPLRDARIAVTRAVCTAADATFATSEMVSIARHRLVGLDERFAFAWDERRDHCHLLRDIFGNPFRPVAFAPEWRTDTATAIARQMYESRDFGAMPILADALQDAGCDSDDILNHCRNPQQIHVRGCWVVDLVLGKE